jgi:hypothetical protein
MMLRMTAKMSNVKYAVGQVLYVVLNKEMRVYPMQIIEEIIKKTLTGEETNYVVRGGTDPKAQLMMTDVDGEIFDSAEDARMMLIDKATASINALVDSAVRKAREWYPGSFESSSNNPLLMLKKTSNVVHAREQRNELYELANELQEETETLIELPGGGQAKLKSVKLPDSMR